MTNLIIRTTGGLWRLQGRPLAEATSLDEEVVETVAETVTEAPVGTTRRLRSDGAAQRVTDAESVRLWLELPRGW
jgi:hypothetical protein